MSEAVSWILMVTVKDGKLDDLRALMEEMVAATKDQPGAEMYEWFVSADGKKVHLYERYADSDAALAQLGAFGQHFAERFFGCVDFAGFNVYGIPSQAAKEALASAGARILGPFGGFVR